MTDGARSVKEELFYDSEDVVTANVLQLCHRMIPDVQETTVAYCLKILSSRLATGSTAVQSVPHVLERIRKAVKRTNLKKVSCFCFVWFGGGVSIHTSQNTNSQNACCFSLDNWTKQ